MTMAVLAKKKTVEITVSRLTSEAAAAIWQEIDAEVTITPESELCDAIHQGNVVERRDAAAAVLLVEWKGGIDPLGASILGFPITSVSRTGIVFTGTATSLGTIERMADIDGTHRALVYVGEDFA